MQIPIDWSAAAAFWQNSVVMNRDLEFWKGPLTIRLGSAWAVAHVGHRQMANDSDNKQRQLHKLQSLHTLVWLQYLGLSMCAFVGRPDEWDENGGSTSEEGENNASYKTIKGITLCLMNNTKIVKGNGNGNGIKDGVEQRYSSRMETPEVQQYSPCRRQRSE